MQICAAFDGSSKGISELFLPLSQLNLLLLKTSGSQSSQGRAPQILFKLTMMLSYSIAILTQESFFGSFAFQSDEFFKQLMQKHLPPHISKVSDSYNCLGSVRMSALIS